jgi:hypothetical protein
MHDSALDSIDSLSETWMKFYVCTSARGNSAAASAITKYLGGTSLFCYYYYYLLFKF